ncbi:MAG: hypothetical protein Ct9H300mP1_16740 [Planctomycetaceae bacterium]|nr:MAG: hypothetical protein Ct9H300mP1_16740 [Planctomycetaceae bacterium]
MVVATDRPGAGPPKGGWVPRQGLVFATIKRPEGDNPKTVADLQQLMAASTERYGARYQQRIADGHNPFGPSDYYISVYKGWIRIPKDGVYRFCTASNEASFSFLDGKAADPLARSAHIRTWCAGRIQPEGRTEGGDALPGVLPRRGDAQAGRFPWLESARIQKGHYAGIPGNLYPMPHSAQVVAYESPTVPLASFVPIYVDTIWPDPGVRASGQYTRVRLGVEVAGSFPKGTTFAWDLGDGQSASGATVDHVYLSLGRFPGEVDHHDRRQVAGRGIVC